MTDFLLLILYASTPFAIIALTICLGNKLAERRAVELHWRQFGNPFREVLRFETGKQVNGVKSGQPPPFRK